MKILEPYKPNIPSKQPVAKISSSQAKPRQLPSGKRVSCVGYSGDDYQVSLVQSPCHCLFFSFSAFSTSGSVLWRYIWKRPRI